jgi:glycine oxidase
MTAPPAFRSTALPRVAIIGGGVIGLSITWRLAAAGCPVDLFDAHESGRGASWAAAGMLAAALEAEPGEEPLLELTRASAAQWPDFARRLEAASGYAVGYRDEGTIAVALTRDDSERLRSAFEFQRRLGLDLEWLSGSAVREREPFLSPRVSAGIFSATDHQVDNRRLVEALKIACRASGGRLHEQAWASVLVAGDRVRGVRVGAQTYPADKVVIAAGAWSRAVEGLPAATLPPIRPVKGQMLMLQMDAARPLLRHVVWAPRAYLVPRRDGRLLIGATVEERGFDTTVTAGAIYTLLDGAWRVLPALEDLPLIETWAGSRPGSRDDAPILGSTAVDGLVLATGHHRNGILLTPLTAEAIAEFVLTGTLPAAIQRFGLHRFERPAAPSPAEAVSP